MVSAIFAFGSHCLKNVDGGTSRPETRVGRVEGLDFAYVICIFWKQEPNNAIRNIGIRNEALKKLTKSETPMLNTF